MKQYSISEAQKKEIESKLENIGIFIEKIYVLLRELYKEKVPYELKKEFEKVHRDYSKIHSLIYKLIDDESKAKKDKMHTL